VLKINSVKYTVDCSYFGLESSEHDYILFKETDLLNCATGEVTVCPANTAIYSAKTSKCLASIFFPDYNLQQSVPKTPTNKSSNSQTFRNINHYGCFIFRSNDKLFSAALKAGRLGRLAMNYFLTPV
jgi:hypothetical protein